MKTRKKEDENKTRKENEVEFETKMSRGISWFYITTMILLGVLGVIITIFTPLNTIEKILLIGLFACIDLVLYYMLARAKRTLYTLNQHEIKIYGAMGTKTISYDQIESIKESAIPCGLRLYGSSFLGGWYYLPGIGRTWVSMTNFKDGVLITAQDNRKYLITPKEPRRFIEIIENKISGMSSMEV
ncbi:MAG: hypothetical protein JSW00_08890 [Thermoplasmata archaeon]|nr:MAG: hypothetical protein JSW00_08890 [Thermoplasmata archaeon]